MPFSKLVRLGVLLGLVALVFGQQLNAGLGLLCGLIYALSLGNPFRNFTQKWAGLILKISVVGLGFGLNLKALWVTTLDGLWLTVCTIVFALFGGLLLGRLLGVNKKLSMLISTGTSICGGSAIAAMSPAINAKQQQTVISISIVFILNGIALYVYPFLGHWLELTQTQFGLWAALGIHDTSSVVGAASLYGDEALKVATTTKLARALWIIPLVFGASVFMNSGDDGLEKRRWAFPYFILLFLVASGVSTFFGGFGEIAEGLVYLAKIGLVLSLLFMGAGFTWDLVKQIDFRAMVQGVVLWVLVSLGSLVGVWFFY